MRFPIHITTDQVGYQIRKAAAGETRYPLVLMLEPLYTCNLACIGCSIERHTGKLEDRLPLETCLRGAWTNAARRSCRSAAASRRSIPELPELVDGDHRAQAAHLPVHQRAGAGHQGVRRDRAAQAAHDQRSPRRDAGDARQGLRPRGRVRQGDRDDQGGQAARLPRHDQHDRLQGDRRSRRSRSSASWSTSMGVDGMLSRRATTTSRSTETSSSPSSEIHQKFRRVLELSKEYRMHVDADVPGVRGRACASTTARPGAP